MELPKFKHEFNLSGESLLPHRPPFLFVDRLISADETGAIGEYTFTLEKNDFFKGHFPGFPIVPGVILIEAMAQIAGAAVVARGVLALAGQCDSQECMLGSPADIFAQKLTVLMRAADAARIVMPGCDRASV